MRDLRVAHPTNPECWCPCGRVGDVIVFADGKKLNPIRLESVIRSHHAVISGIICDHGKPLSALLVHSTKYPAD